jgi:CubicO group peptidase (beta-lactamase class C family)
LSQLRQDAHPLAEQRAWLAGRVLADAPEALAADEYRYSNYGYVVAGAMLERAAGTSFEELLRAELFEPLAMTSCGFGVPATPGLLDQPWGHRRRLAGLSPVEPGPGADNPLALGPAGTVHCSLRDWVKFLSLHLRGARGHGSPFLAQSAFEILHAPRARAPQPYALGWIVAERAWAGAQPVLTHTGSNTTFIAQAWLAPERDFGVAVVANAADDAARAALKAVVGAAIARLDSRR